MISFALTFLLFASVHGQIETSENFTHNAILDADDKVLLYWKFNDTHITFEVHGQTTGWLGIGISPNGGMTNADIFVGWVKNGQAYITDRHGDDHDAFPPKDVEQNVELLAGSECNGWTMLKFRRQLAACEDGFDLPVTGDTLKIIYAYGGNDPIGDDIIGANYHGTSRGTKSLYLLDGATSGDDVKFPEGETHLTFDLLNENFQLPPEVTYYNCRLHKLPELKQKHHLVKIDPVIQPGNEMFVHHILVYQCFSNISGSEDVGKNAKCYTANMPPDFESCILVIQAWAIGGGAFYYPKHTGYPLGDIGSPTYVVVETHYDNPEKRAGVVDSSGLRFTYTPQLRKYDSGIMEVGHTVTGIQHIIPPNAQSFLDYGDCSQECLTASIQQGREGNLKVFGTLLHSHLLGRGITLKHIRNGTELPNLARDDSYDFDYQETRTLTEERVVQEGDSLQTVCNYNSKDRTGFSVGGLDTQREMCMAFVYYYPKMPMSFCQTAPEFNTFLNYFGITAVESLVPSISIYDDLSVLLITAPPQIANQTVEDHLNSMEWNDVTIKQLSDDLRDMKRIQFCLGLLGVPGGIESVIDAVTIDVPYIEVIANCTEPSSGMPTNGTEGQCFEASTESMTTDESQTQFVTDTTDDVIVTDGLIESTTGSASAGSVSPFYFLLTLSVLRYLY